MTAYTIFKKQVGCTATCFLYQSMQEKLPVAGSLHIRSMNENASGLVSGSSLDQINENSAEENSSWPEYMFHDSDTGS